MYVGGGMIVEAPYTGSRACRAHGLLVRARQPGGLSPEAAFPSHPLLTARLSLSPSLVAPSKPHMSVSGPDSSGLCQPAYAPTMERCE